MSVLVIRALALAFALLVPACSCGPKPMIERPDGGMCSGECLSGIVHWRWFGGLAVPSHSFTMFPCRAFSIDGNGYCTGVITCFDSRINALLADPVITAAGDAGTIFGRDPRPSDGQVMQVSAPGGVFHIGICNSTTPCPPQATELAALLKAVSDDPPCQTFADGGFCSNECTSETVTWQWIGGNTVFELRSTLATCQRYTLEKVQSGVVTATCTAEARCYASELNYALADPVISQALAQHTLFGRDTRPSDGQVLRVTAPGGSFDIGICDQMTSCPSAVTRLRNVLLAFDDQQPCVL